MVWHWECPLRAWFWWYSLNNCNKWKHKKSFLLVAGLSLWKAWPPHQVCVAAWPLGRQLWLRGVLQPDTGWLWARTQEETNQKKALYDSWSSSAETFPGEQNLFETFLPQPMAPFQHCCSLTLQSGFKEIQKPCSSLLLKTSKKPQKAILSSPGFALLCTIVP